MGGTMTRPVPSCPTCCVPQVDLHGLAGNLQGRCVLLEHGGDIGLAGDREGGIQVTQAAVGAVMEGTPVGTEQGTGREAGSGKWCFLPEAVPWESPLSPIPGQYRASWMPQGDLGIQDRGSGVSVAAPFPCTP